MNVWTCTSEVESLNCVALLHDSITQAVFCAGITIIVERYYCNSIVERCPHTLPKNTAQCFTLISSPTVLPLVLLLLLCDTGWWLIWLHNGAHKQTWHIHGCHGQKVLETSSRSTFITSNKWTPLANTPHRAMQNTYTISVVAACAVLPCSISRSAQQHTTLSRKGFPTRRDTAMYMY